jgi:hypothetical protein
MALASPRADNLNIICDLVWLVSVGEICDSASFRAYTTNRQFVDGRKSWKPTRQYHYVSALRDLQLANITRERADLTGRGCELAGVVQFGRLRPRELSDHEREFLRTHLLSYRPFVAFLERFLVSSKKFQGYDQLRSDGGILAFEKDRETGDQYLIKANREKEPLPKKMVYELKWTLKNWSKDLGLIDEIFLEQAMNNVGDRHKRIFFPVKTKLSEVPLEDLRSRIDSLIDTTNGANRVRIPLLMYDFCVRYFAAVEEFHCLLRRLSQEFPDHYRLEKISSVFIDERPHKINGYSNYTRTGNVYRYSLVVK